MTCADLLSFNLFRQSFNEVSVDLILSASLWNLLHLLVSHNMFLTTLDETKSVIIKFLFRTNFLHLAKELAVRWIALDADVSLFTSTEKSADESSTMSVTASTGDPIRKDPDLVNKESFKKNIKARCSLSLQGANVHTLRQVESLLSSLYFLRTFSVKITERETFPFRFFVRRTTQACY